MEQIIQTVQNLDWSPLYISLKTGIAATIVSFFLGIAAARLAFLLAPTEETKEVRQVPIFWPIIRGKAMLKEMTPVALNA